MTGPVIRTLDEERVLPSREKWLIVAVAVIAFSLRAWPVMRRGVLWAISLNPYDATGYLQLSEGFRHGCGFARWVNSACSAHEILRAPGYPLFLALVGNLSVIVILQALMGALVCVLLATFLHTQWGYPRRSNRTQPHRRTNAY